MDGQDLVDVSQVFVDLLLHLADQSPAFDPMLLPGPCSRLINLSSLNMYMSLVFILEGLSKHLVEFNLKPLFLEVLVLLWLSLGVNVWSLRGCRGLPILRSLKRLRQHIDQLVTCLIEFVE